MTAKQRDLHKFTFRLRGHGQDVPAGVYEAELRSKTYDGIAAAMASQWGASQQSRQGTVEP